MLIKIKNLIINSLFYYVNYKDMEYKEIKWKVC